jgi:hypothetical protein
MKKKMFYLSLGITPLILFSGCCNTCQNQPQQIIKEPKIITQSLPQTTQQIKKVTTTHHCCKKVVKPEIDLTRDYCETPISYREKKKIIKIEETRIEL